MIKLLLKINIRLRHKCACDTLVYKMIMWVSYTPFPDFSDGLLPQHQEPVPSALGPIMDTCTPAYLCVCISKSDDIRCICRLWLE